MTLSAKQWLEEAETPRLHTQPLWVRELVRGLANQLRMAHASEQRTAEKAAQEVEHARALLAEGPADSDTFLNLPHSAVADVGWDDVSVRPLGRGVTVEFRDTSGIPGDGFEVSLADGRLTITGINHLDVRPVDPTTLTVGAA